MAKERNMKINEYGIYKEGKRLGGENEKDIYTHLGLDYIEPEMRENRGEIALAQNHTLPKLIKLSDIRGDLHMHTRYSDGMNTIKEMAQAALKKGYEYIAVTDHTKHLSVAHGLDEKNVRAQLEEIDKLNEELKGITILKSAEVDILEDGTLDLSDAVLSELDLVLCGIHYKFDLSKEQQTKRILKAMEHPAFTILAHPTGRLINLREPYEVDMEAVIDAAKERGYILELNAQPDRLDLNDRHCRMAKEAGVPIAISTDAHSVQNLELMRYGIGQARRGWQEKEDVINTRSLKELQKLLNKIKG
jgi:DNA polymerase (family 10)